MIAYSFWMTILIVIYHLAPHLIDLEKYKGDIYCRHFFETFGSIALNYFFAASAYKFFVSKKSYKIKLKKRIKTLIIPFVVWNTIYIILYILQKGIPGSKTLILGYTLAPFDGPLWYIFVIYIFFVIYSVIIKHKNISYLRFFIILLSFSAAMFHALAIKKIIYFPYIFWVERTCRMLPAFLAGMYFARKHNAVHKKNSNVVAALGAATCILMATYLGDGFVTIILMYLCTFLLWLIFPNIILKSNSIMRNEMFSVYALHEGVIVIVLALINNLKIVVITGTKSVIAGIMIVTSMILIIGIIFNFCLKKLPAIFDILFTGGRNRIGERG